MANIPNSSLPFGDSAQNGNVVDGPTWNQMVQVIQTAVNDNQTQITAIKNAQTTILVTVGTAYPANPSNGQLCFRSDLGNMYVYTSANTTWEEVVSVAPSANGITINGTSYNASTSATANTLALRDSLGNIAANQFTGSATQLGGLPATDYLRTDAGAPSPQTVTNPVALNGGMWCSFVTSSTTYTIPLSIVGGYALFNGATSDTTWTMPDASLCSGGKIIVRNNLTGHTLTLQSVNSQNFYGASNGTTLTVPSGDTAVVYSIGNGWIVAGGNNFNLFVNSATFAGTGSFTGNVTAPNIGGASGTWTPASGTLNVPSGTVINITSVPGNANMFHVTQFNGYQATAGYDPSVIGSSASNGNTMWNFDIDASHTYTGTATTGTSGPTSSYISVYDGSYSTSGYFRIYGGYLQFVTTVAPAASANAGQSYYWGVR